MNDGDYRRLLGRLFSARRFGVELGLGRVRACLDAMGRPDESFRVVQVGGTNGKGTTATMLSALFEASGLRTGLYTSPHLCRLSERFVIGSREVSRQDVADALEAVDRASSDSLTFFELVTCMALWLFREEGVELAVLEVGLGGRLDATTAAHADAVVVTGVDRDHEAWLGNDLREIALEKAAIARVERPAVVGRSGAPEMRAVVAAAMAERGATPVHMVSEADVEEVSTSHTGIARIAAATAVAAARLMDVDLGVERTRSALDPVSVRGRRELIEREDTFLLDGAHNPAAARCLSRELVGDDVLVVGLSAEKDASAIAEALGPPVRAIVVTRAQSERAMDPAGVAEAFRSAAPKAEIHVAASVPEALQRAAELAQGHRVVIAGSLFVVGEARAYLVGDVVDPTDLAEHFGSC